MKYKNALIFENGNSIKKNRKINKSDTTQQLRISYMARRKQFKGKKTSKKWILDKNNHMY